MDFDEIFPDPNEAPDEVPVGPEDDFADEELGTNPVEEARQPRKRLALGVIAAAVVVLGAVLLFAMGGDDSSNGNASGGFTGAVDSTAQAQTPSSRDNSDESDPLAITDPATPGQEPDDFIEPGEFADEFALSGGRQQDTSSSGLEPYSPSGGVQRPQGGQRQAGGNNPYLPEDTVQAPPGVSGEELARQARLDAQREEQARQRAQRQAEREARLAEEERLRGQGTQIASGNVDITARNSGRSRFATGAGAPAGSVSAPSGTGGALAPGGNNGTAGQFNITPGTRVRAETTSEFISDQQGSGRVQARLTSSLRNANGDVVLPVGTRAFGNASAAGGTGPGQDARAQLTFDIFVRPDGSVIRSGLSGEAADPETLAMSVPADVDHHYPERLLRGAASTALELALTSGEDDRRSAFEAPSPRDQAINDARRRVARIIEGDVGDETSVAPAIKLESGTELVLIFGL